MGTLFASANGEGWTEFWKKLKLKVGNTVQSVNFRTFEKSFHAKPTYTADKDGKHRRPWSREGRAGDVRPSGSKLSEHSKPGSTRGGPSWLPAGQRRQGWQEEPVRPGGAGRGRPEGRPVHQGHRWQQAHSHCLAGAVPARASKEGA